MLVNYVAGEGVELTAHKESVVVEEIKKVELRSRRAQFIYERNYNGIGLRPRNHAPSRLPVKKLRHLSAQNEKSKAICMEEYPEKYHFLTTPPHSPLIHNHDAEVYAPIASCFFLILVSFSLVQKEFFK